MVMQYTLLAPLVLLVITGLIVFLLVLAIKSRRASVVIGVVLLISLCGVGVVAYVGVARAKVEQKRALREAQRAEALARIEVDRQRQALVLARDAERQARVAARDAERQARILIEGEDGRHAVQLMEQQVWVEAPGVAEKAEVGGAGGARVELEALAEVDLYLSELFEKLAQGPQTDVAELEALQETLRELSPAARRSLAGEIAGRAAQARDGGQVEEVTDGDGAAGYVVRIQTDDLAQLAQQEVESAAEGQQERPSFLMALTVVAVLLAMTALVLKAATRRHVAADSASMGGR